MTIDSSEHRAFYRVKAGVAVSLKNAESKEAFIGKLLDIGVGGICVELGTKLTMYDSYLTGFKLTLDKNDKTFNLKGRVIRVGEMEDYESYFIGIELLALSDENRKFITDYVRIKKLEIERVIRNI